MTSDLSRTKAATFLRLPRFCLWQYGELSVVRPTLSLKGQQLAYDPMARGVSTLAQEERETSHVPRVRGRNNAVCLS